MSILLDSLNGSKNNNGEVPSIDDSHFDDEMLSDEWLLKKLKFWKTISFALVILIVSSWFYYYLSKTDPDVDIAHFEERVKKEVKKMLLNKELALQNQSNSEASNNSTNEQDDSDLHNIATVTKKNIYQPKKVEVPAAAVRSISTTNQPVFNKHQGQKNVEIVDYESLSDEERRTMPDLEISSYAVSNNAGKSFVVLNGSFYAQEETVAPDLVLVSIKKEGVVFRYKGKQIRKKYNQ